MLQLSAVSSVRMSIMLVLMERALLVRTLLTHILIDVMDPVEMVEMVEAVELILDVVDQENRPQA